MATAAASTGFVAPLAELLRPAMIRVKSQPLAGRPLRILALNPDRFRGDLQCLADTGEVEITLFPFAWQGRFVQTFYPPQSNFFDYFSPDDDAEGAVAKRALQRVLRPLMREIKRRWKFDLVVGAAVHYQQDVDFGEAAEAAGMPYVVFHRECFHASPAGVAGNIERLRRMGPFKGSMIVMHNEPSRQTFLDSGFAGPDQCVALGALRMDEFVARINTAKEQDKNGRKLAVLFSFSHGSGQSGLMNHWSPDGQLGFVKLFVETHVAFARLSLRLPQVDFLIKPKFSGEFVERIERALEEAGLRLSAISNLRIDSSANAQDLIMKADAVAAFNSTTMLEAAVAAKPVIVPFFEEAARAEYQDWIQLKNEMHLFETADSPEVFQDLIERRLWHWTPSGELLEERRRAFERWVAPLDRGVSRAYVALLRAVIERRTSGSMPQVA